MSYKILIADDEPDIIEILEYNLSKNDFKVITASTGKEAKEMAIQEKPDVILLDIMMPEGDGVEVCSELREMAEFENTIIAFLTARSEDYTQIACFDVGADDFINKPIKPKVLIARINALLKRKRQTDDSSTIIELGNLIIDKQRRIITLNDTELYLPKKEFDILSLLASKPGIVFTRKDIYLLIWGIEIFVGDRTIDVHIRKIREKIGDHFITTIKGIGYKFTHS